MSEYAADYLKKGIEKLCRKYGTPFPGKSYNVALAMLDRCGSGEERDDLSQDLLLEISEACQRLSADERLSPFCVSAECQDAFIMSYVLEPEREKARE